MYDFLSIILVRMIIDLKLYIYIYILMHIINVYLLKIYICTY